MPPIGIEAFCGGNLFQDVPLREGPRLDDEACTVESTWFIAPAARENGFNRVLWELLKLCSEGNNALLSASITDAIGLLPCLLKDSSGVMVKFQLMAYCPDQ